MVNTPHRKFRRIMARVLPFGESFPEQPCVEWPRAMKSKGYPNYFKFQGVRYNPLRVTWELHNKQAWPEGMVADHRCRNRMCVNPHHIRPMTGFQNILIGNQGGELFHRVLMGTTTWR